MDQLVSLAVETAGYHRVADLFGVRRVHCHVRRQYFAGARAGFNGPRAEGVGCDDFLGPVGSEWSDTQPYASNASYFRRGHCQLNVSGVTLDL